MRGNQTKAFTKRFAEAFPKAQVESPISKEGFSIDVFGWGKPLKKIGIIDQWMRNINLFEYKSPADNTLNTSKLVTYVVTEAYAKDIWLSEIKKEISGTAIVAELSKAQKKKLEKDNAVEIYPGVYQIDLHLFKVYVINIDEIPHTPEWAELLLGGNEQAILDLIYMIFRNNMHDFLSITFVLFNDEVMKVSQELGVVVDKTSISIKKAIEYLGLKRVIDEVGLKQVIDEVGIGRILLEIGPDEFIKSLDNDYKTGKITKRDYVKIVKYIKELGERLKVPS